MQDMSQTNSSMLSKGTLTCVQDPVSGEQSALQTAELNGYNNLLILDLRGKHIMN